jgi:ABC-2 type transport system permease protein
MIRAEFRKLRTVRSTWLLLGIAQLIVIGGVSGLMLQRDDPTSLAGQRGAFGHVGLVALFSLLLGIMAMAGEYRHRTITDTFLAVPRRSRLVGAKLVVGAAAGLVFGVVASLTALVTTEIWLSAKGSALSGDVWRTVLGGIGWNVAFAALGVGLGALITNLIAAVTTALAWLALVEGIVGQLAGGAAKWLPFALGSAVEGISGPPAWQAALGLAGYAAAFALAGILMTQRRDVT